MILKRLMAVLLFIWLLPTVGKSQTVLLAEPVADKQGMIAFKITQIIRVEGLWEKSFALDQLIYPLRPEKAIPLGRFGEAVLIVYRKAGNLSQWQGLNIHNGCIPALNGKPSEELLADIAKMPPPEVPASRTYKPSEANANFAGAEYAICPICKVRHIRIR
jgi:hypothetical protein